MKEKSICYEFNNFRLDTRTTVLYYEGKPVALKPKIVETLTFLVENSGEIVSKDELMRGVWQDSFVAENSLSVNIYTLRKTFGKLDGQTEYIQTIPRRGFRFAAEVRKVEKLNGEVSQFSAPNNESNSGRELPNNVATTPPSSTSISQKFLLAALVIGGLFFVIAGL